MKRTIEELLAAEAHIDRGFSIVVVPVLIWVAWTVYLPATGQSGRSWAWLVSLILVFVTLGGYVWFGVALLHAARALNKSVWPVILWVVGAPVVSFSVFFWLALIAGLSGSVFFAAVAQFVALGILASPLALKFTLAGQLRAEIHDRTFAEE